MRGLRPTVSARADWTTTQVILEIIAQCKLHDSRISLNAGEVIERWARTSELRIEAVGDVRVTCQVLRIRHVEHFPTEREFVFLTPRHLEALEEPGVEREETHASQYVSCARFTRSRTAEALVCSFGIGEQVRRMAVTAAGRRRMNLLDRRRPAP